MESRLVALITATVHPSSILRAADEDARESEMRQLVEDLTQIARHLPPSALIRKSRTG
jgi:DNA polymerase